MIIKITSPASCGDVILKRYPQLKKYGFKYPKREEMIKDMTGKLYRDAGYIDIKPEDLLELAKIKDIIIQYDHKTCSCSLLIYDDYLE